MPSRAFVGDAVVADADRECLLAKTLISVNINHNISKYGERHIQCSNAHYMHLNNAKRMPNIHVEPRHLQKKGSKEKKPVKKHAEPRSTTPIIPCHG
jgi:hypothetical protein